MKESNQLPFYWTGQDMAALAEHFREICLKAMEDALNQLMEEEAAIARGAEKGERVEDRKGSSAGTYDRTIYTSMGPLHLKIPRVRDIAWHPSFLIPRQKTSPELAETIVTNYIDGMSTGNIVNMLERVYGIKLSRGTVSNLNKRFYARVEEWRTRSIDGDKWTFLHVDAAYVHCRRSKKVESVPFFTAVGRDEQGQWDVLGLKDGTVEDLDNWKDFLLHLKERGLSNVDMIIGDGKEGLLEAVKQVYPESVFQVCVVHHHRLVYCAVDGKMRADTAELYKLIFECENREMAEAMGLEVAEVLRGDGREAAARKVEDGLSFTLTHMDWEDPDLWPLIRNNNRVENLHAGTKRRTDAAVVFPSTASALMLIGAKLMQMVHGVRKRNIKSPRLLQSAL